MYTILFNHIAERIPLTRKEREICKRVFLQRSVRRKQYLLQQGDQAKYLFFVCKGSLRSYTIDDKGEEHLVQFAIENWWITDLYSFLTSEPATQTIDAIEDSELLMLDLPSYDLLFKEIPKFEHYFRILLQNNYIAMRKRIVDTISSSAEERYAHFLREQSALAQRVPQHMIASYLGITPETLSRVRKQMSEHHS